MSDSEQNNKEKMMNDQLEEIKEIINTDILAADVKLSMFISAAKSFKADSLLSPFPKTYIVETKLIDELNSDVDMIPNLEELFLLLVSDNTSLLPNTSVNLLHWILTSPKYNISSITRSSFDDILNLTQKSGSLKPARPTHIFRIDYAADSGAESRFRKHCIDTGMNTKYAFHGTRFYNTYSILNHGLQQHLNKTGLYGEGLYFAQELDVSLLFSPSVIGWEKSKLGDVISCVTVCEIIDDPRYVKVRKENAKNSDIPHSYLLITNNEITRVRYLLIYGSKKSIATRKQTAEIGVAQQTNIMQWCRKNPLIVSALLYFVLLFLVGISNHRVVDYYRSIVTRFIQKCIKFS